jgi:hypothetical protein
MNDLVWRFARRREDVAVAYLIFFAQCWARGFVEKRRIFGEVALRDPPINRINARMSSGLLPAFALFSNALIVLVKCRGAGTRANARGVGMGI